MAHLVLLTMVALSLQLLPGTAALEPQPANATNNDRSALLAFRASVRDPRGVLHRSWTARANFCGWLGVSCDARGRRVMALSLPGVPLVGAIPPELGNLSSLSHLNLSRTGLAGMIPAELGRLARLKHLDLKENKLSGTISSSLGNLTELEHLDIGYNGLSGAIPAELQKLRKLRYISLNSNDLSGTIPIGLFNNTPDLSVIWLGRNRLAGTIPHSIAVLRKLEILVLELNILDGPVPPAIFNMSKLRIFGLGDNNLFGSFPGNKSFNLPMLQKLGLSSNHFTGHIQPALARCKNLEVLSLSINNFTGPVPAWLATMPRLYALLLAANNLIGKIPVELSNLTGLVMLDLSVNQLEGEIPPGIGYLKNLNALSFSTNLLTGTIPESIGNISSIRILDLTFNTFTGSVPTTFGNILGLTGLYVGANKLSGKLNFLGALSNCKNLSALGISYNAFTGRIPGYLGNLSSQLQEFIVSFNSLTGSIPNTIANLSSLMIVDLDGNQLSGVIPVSITTLNNLQELNLANNTISGAIPEEISRLTRLVRLYLDKNQLSGSIPSSVGNLSELQYMTSSLNSLSSTIPLSLWHLSKLLSLNLSYNMLTGPLAMDVSQVKQIAQMDLSSNLMTGGLPDSLGRLQMLNYLNLSNNSFHEQIPSSFGGLVSIETMDLSYNSLSGSIPASLANLTFLTSLNLSFNRLDGAIPDSGVFSNITLQSLRGNNALCGLPRLGISPCQSNHRSQESLIKIILPIVGGFAILATCLCVLLRTKIKKWKKVSIPSESSIINYPLISFHELVRATTNFSESNLIGSGNFGKVFKGQLDDESIVAVKVLSMQHEGASVSFHVECSALRMARHRNLVRILSTCSNFEFKALVLQYMPNGSLDSWLHSSNSQQCLGFLKRLEIMLEVAMAMEYLHHQKNEVVLHCDIKPSNVLLDEDMTAHVADFGIAKLLLGDNNSVALTSMPGTIGYMAPEYGSTGKASRMSDVFSYGIMLLEVFTGKRPTDPMFSGELSLWQWVSEAFPSKLIDVIDHKILSTGSRSRFHADKSTLQEQSAILNTCLASVIELSLRCSSTIPDERTPMNNVVVKLNKIKVHYCSQQR
ncbi:hypothetical protein BRADI_2g47256v3 [Brachypodium distachyon]|uniref:non-specific serine/threonine protein kinase n=2 Tax=Brachypodium distachyon TaxID=15368 RepID=A0A2K2DEB0_BRADI|nr:hypothetical protein BRADI_2g47256v3 [Brachypodium distachyon]